MRTRPGCSCAAPRGRAAAALIAHGALDGLSIGFRARSWRPRRGPRGEKGRVLTEIDLWEVSIVTFPMLREARLSLVPAPARKAA